MYELQCDIPASMTDEMRRRIADVIIDARQSRATLARLFVWRNRFRPITALSEMLGVRVTIAMFDLALAEPKPRRLRTRV
ncbi:MAG: hypothetical protein NVS1B2_16070 [Vulcanimicrobiaceae bacterium]